ncbi:MAG: glycosyl transferase, partial [Candidatus Saccharibacteria bacterium]|nr:glycosyl transferase [Candidatus Saccharibacteria bacterium]
MIFVCVGSREYQFDRLLKELDHLVENGTIKERVIAQIANSSYIPINYEYVRFLDKAVFEKYQNEADLIISHGGTGALIGALKKRKQ